MQDLVRLALVTIGLVLAVVLLQELAGVLRKMR
jgi:hypothetical protein